MRFFTVSLSLLVLAATSAPAATALNALRVLLPEQVKNVALVAGRDGAPEPESWHILVFDPQAELGLREFVVTGARRTANRQHSQFAERLTVNDVFGPEAIKIDSERVGKLAMQYGVVNNVSVASIHYDLRKGSSEGGPLWTVICADNSGAELGRLIVSATRGNVLMHPGFALEPPLESVGERAVTGTSRNDPSARTTAAATRKTSPPKKTATPLPLSTPKQNLLQRLFGGGNAR